MLPRGAGRPLALACCAPSQHPLPSTLRYCILDAHCWRTSAGSGRLRDCCALATLCSVSLSRAVISDLPVIQLKGAACEADSREDDHTDRAHTADDGLLSMSRLVRCYPRGCPLLCPSSLHTPPLHTSDAQSSSSTAGGHLGCLFIVFRVGAGCCLHTGCSRVGKLNAIGRHRTLLSSPLPPLPLTPGEVPSGRVAALPHTTPHNDHQAEAQRGAATRPYLSTAATLFSLPSTPPTPPLSPSTSLFIRPPHSTSTLTSVLSHSSFYLKPSLLLSRSLIAAVLYSSLPPPFSLLHPSSRHHSLPHHCLPYPGSFTLRPALHRPPVPCPRPPSPWMSTRRRR